MKNKYAKMSVTWGLCALMLFSSCISTFGQKNRIERVHSLYDSLKAYHIDNPETVLATAIFETGWMECNDCSYQMNNLFGFRVDTEYISFKNTSECLKYMQKWQAAFYAPWREKHPQSSYYDFLCHIKYAANMSEYVKNINSIEHWIRLNIRDERPDFMGLEALVLPNMRN
jgi:mannosyl-glycoprotein endo-beta-N-acetylglucosaminidase